MSDFKDKVHKNRFRLGLRPRSRWGSLQHSPRPSSWNKRDLLLREVEGRRGRGRVGKGKTERGERDKKGGGGAEKEGMGGRGRKRGARGESPYQF